MRLEHQIIETVCKLSGVRRDSIIGYCRAKSVSRARMAIFALLRRHTDMSLDEIGELMDRDHSTVSHGSAVAESATDEIITAYMDATARVLKLTDDRRKTTAYTVETIHARAAAMMEDV